MTSPTVAFMFPGQGSQSVGMLADLAARHPGIRATFDEAAQGAGVDLWTLAQSGPPEQLNQTECTQPALLAASIALWRLWQERGGAHPAWLAGHSLGEYSALVAAGVLTLADGARLVRLRGQWMQAAVPDGIGAMAAVLGADSGLVEQVCHEVSDDENAIVVPANDNAPGQIVIGGHAAAVQRALERLADYGVRKAVKLAVSVPSHTPLMRDAANRLSEAMRGLNWQPPQIPVLHNVDAAVHHDVDAIRDALARQLYLPVRWNDSIKALAASGVTCLAECGPGKVLTGLAKRIDPTLAARALGTANDFDAALAAWT